MTAREMTTMSEFEGERTAATGTERAFIAVGLDEGPASAAALRWAAEHSRSTGLPLHVIPSLPSLPA